MGVITGTIYIGNTWHIRKTARAEGGGRKRNIIAKFGRYVSIRGALDPDKNQSADDVSFLHYIYISMRM
jgi:hypothetical protein